MRIKQVLKWIAVSAVILGSIALIIQMQFPYLPKGRLIEGKIIKTDYASGWGVSTNDFPKLEFSVDNISPKFQKQGLEVRCSFSKGDVQDKLVNNEELNLSESNCFIK